jgi:hypothetical protein
MMMSPMAIGMFVVPVWKRLTKSAVDGTKCPMATPIAIARKIQSVRKRSRNESFLRQRERRLPLSERERRHQQASQDVS